MGKPLQTKPPSFKPCLYCKREFGSRSLQIHQSQCTKRDSRDQEGTTRSSEKKTGTMRMNSMSDDDNDVETSMSEDQSLSSSWSKHKSKRLKKRWKMEHNHRRLNRPTTAVLKRPRVLDETLKHKVDMTMTRKHFLAAFKLCPDLTVQRSRSNTITIRNTRVSVGYRRDSVLNYPISRPNKNSDAKTKAEMTSASTKIPHYNPPSSDQSGRKTADLSLDQISGRKNKLMKKARNQLIGKVLEPCNSCGRSDLPERFHTHLPSENEQTSSSGNESSKIPIRSSTTNKKIKSVVEENREQQNVANKRETESKQLQKSRNSRASKANSPNKKYESDSSPESKMSPRKPNFNSNKPLTTIKPKNELDTNVDKTSNEDSDNQISTSSSGSTGSTVNEKRLRQKVSENKKTNKSSKSQVYCQICGKPFGQVSIKFHEPQCKKKEQALKERMEKKNKEEEKKEQTYFYESSGDGTPFDDTFEAIWEAHVQQLVPCLVCGRTFFPDRIEVHKKWCKGLSPSKAVSVLSLQPQKMEDSLEQQPDNENVTNKFDSMTLNDTEVEQQQQVQHTTNVSSSASVADLMAKIGLENRVLGESFTKSGQLQIATVSESKGCPLDDEEFVSQFHNST